MLHNEVTSAIVGVIVIALFIRLAVFIPHLLFQAVGIDRATGHIHLVPAIAITIAEHGVHGVDAVLYRRVSIINDDVKSGLSELLNICLLALFDFLESPEASG